MLYENLSYPDALRRLADMNGIAVMEEQESPELERMRRERRAIIAINQIAGDYFHRLLCRSPEAAPAREYLKTRHITLDMAKNWQLGWAPSSPYELQHIVHQHNYPAYLLDRAYIVKQSERGNYAVFKERLMFPIHNLRGELIGFSGRILDNATDPRKYVNTSDTIAFHKGEQLFGLNKATRAIGQNQMTVILCEGQIDVLSCHEKAGLGNVVAGLGTAFTQEQALLLRKYAKRAILCYDGDGAGIKASEKAYQKLAAAGMEVYQALLPMGEDPDSLIEKEGKEALQQMIAAAKPYLEQRAAQSRQIEEQDSHQRAASVNEMAELAAEIIDPAHRDIATADLATRLHLGLEQMRDLVAHYVKLKQKDAQKQHDRGPAHPERLEESDWDDRPVEPTRLHPSIRGLIILATGNPLAQDMLVERMEDLQEAIAKLHGGELLARVMEALPQKQNTEQWQAFLAKLAPAQAAALQKLEPAPQELDETALYVEQACERLARDCIKVDIDLLRSSIKDPRLSMEEQISKLEQITQLQRLLNESSA